MALPNRNMTWLELLGEQDAVLSRWQALEAGMTRSAWEHRIRTGRWQLVLPGVAAAHSGDVTWRQRAWAATVYAGEGAALSGDAAVHLAAQAGDRSRAEAPPERIDVAVPANCKVSRRAFFVPHRCSALDVLRHPARRPSQLRVAPAVLHSAAWAKTARAAEWRLAAPVQSRLVRVSDLRSALSLLPRLHRWALMRSVLVDAELGAHAGTELDFLALLRRHGLPLPDRMQRRLRSNGLYYLDCWWQGRRVAVEIDGGHHREVRTWDHDTLRGNEVQLAHSDRLLLLRYTGGNLRHDEPLVATQLGRAFA